MSERTALMTLILFAPKSFSVTVKESFSSSAAAAPSAGAAAIATGAAAVTPNSSSIAKLRSRSSRIVIPLMMSSASSTFAICLSSSLRSLSLCSLTLRSGCPDRSALVTG